MDSLSYAFFASLIPSAALLGGLFAYWRRKQPASRLGALLWSASNLGIPGLFLGVIPWMTRSDFLEEWAALACVFASGCAFAFTYPICAHYCWRLELRAESNDVGFADALVFIYLTLLGMIWFALICFLSVEIIKEVMRLIL